MTTQHDGMDSDTGRRRALRGLGVSLAALVMLPQLGDEASAKKRGKKRKSRKKNGAPGQEEDRCLPQVASCEQELGRYCASVPDPSQCQAVLFPCCQPLGTCQSDQTLQCIFTVLFTKA